MDLLQDYLENSHEHDIPVIGILAGDAHFGMIIDDPSTEMEWGDGEYTTLLLSRAYGYIPVYYKARAPLTFLISPKAFKSQK